MTNLRNGVALVLRKRPQLFDLLGRQRVRPAKQPAAFASCRKACVSPLLDEIPLKLSKGAENVEDELASACPGVQLLLQGLEVHTPTLKLADRLNEVSQRPAQPVETPHNEGVPGSQVGHGLCKPWAVGEGTGRGVGEDVLTACVCERVPLEIEGVVKG